MNLTQRLKPYQVPHSLIHKLERYDVTRPAVSIFRGQSWNTLKIWALLLDEDDEALLRLVGVDPDSEIPTPDEWFGRVKV